MPKNQQATCRCKVIYKPSITEKKLDQAVLSFFSAVLSLSRMIQNPQQL